MSQRKKMNKVISLLGPTASGKTDFAILLSKVFDLEIISVDSVMIYKEFNIGSAKPDSKILTKFPHRMVNILEPYEKYSVAKFYDNLIENINDIHLNNKIPILVGGSMMYFKTFFSGGLSDLEKVPNNIKNLVGDMVEKKGLKYSYNFLNEIDQVSAKKIHFNDKYRITRMLEIYFSNNNNKPSEILQKCAENVQCFRNLNLSIIPNDRSLLHKSIEKRMNFMLNGGLLDEVSHIKKKYEKLSLPAMSTIGYKQAAQYLNGELDLESMKSKILSSTRQLAKRQITWLRHLDYTTVYTSMDYDNIESRVRYFLNEQQ
jgi:tRNA dimethylallyltransferase